MLAFKNSKGDSPQCIPNALPCRINRNGPVNASERYWLPKESQDGKSISYIRGRKLLGKIIRVPERYVGVILSSTEKALPKDTKSLGVEELDEDGDNHEHETMLLLKEAEFDEIVVWGHEVIPDGKDNAYVRGLEEWVAFAENVHSCPAQEAQRTNGSRKS